MKPLLQLGPFGTLNATSDPFYLKDGEGVISSNVDVSAAPEALVSALGRSVLAAGATIPNNTVVVGVAQFNSYTGEAFPTSNIGNLQLLFFSAVELNSNISYCAVLNLKTGVQTAVPLIQPWTQAVQFTDTLYTNGGDRVVVASDGTINVDYWQIDATQLKATPGGNLSALSYNITAGHFDYAGGPAKIADQKYQYAVTFRRAADWTIVSGSGPTNPSPNGGPSPPQPMGAPGSITPPAQGNFIITPDLPTYQESSPILTPLMASSTTHGTNVPCLSVPAGVAALSDLVQGFDTLADGITAGEPYYGVLYRASTSQPTFVMVDYLVNFPQGVDHAGTPCFVDLFGDGDIVNNVIMTIHNDVPPIVGQTYPGPALDNLNTQNSGPIQSFQQKNHNRSFAYLNPSFITKHKNRMFVFTMYPTTPLFYKGSSPTAYDNRAQFQPQLWYSNYGVPWSFNDVDQLLLVGPEDAAGNNAIDTQLSTDIWSATYTKSPWQPDQVCDTPMGLASTGSLMCLFKQQSVWVLFGDSPAEFQQGLRRAFNYGCISTPSITPAEGGVFWLCGDPLAVWFFDGAAPSYISEPIRGQLQQFPLSELQNAAGGYSERTFYLMFPPSDNPNSPAFNKGITYCYYTAGQKWYTLPYGGQLLFSPSHTKQSQGMALSDPTTDPDAITSLNLNLWLLRNAVTDIGNPVKSTWLSKQAASEVPGTLTKYSFVTLTAAPQDAVVTITVTIDDGSINTNEGQNIYTKTWDLNPLGIGSAPIGQGGFSPFTRVASLPAQAIGYSAQVQVDVTNNSTTQQANITSVVLLGENHGPCQSTATFDGSQGNVSP